MPVSRESGIPRSTSRSRRIRLWLVRQGTRDDNSRALDWQDPIRVRSFGSNLRKNPLSRDGANPWCFGDDRFPLEVIRRFSCGGSCEDSSVVAGGGLDPTRLAMSSEEYDSDCDFVIETERSGDEVEVVQPSSETVTTAPRSSKENDKFKPARNTRGRRLRAAAKERSRVWAHYTRYDEPIMGIVDGKEQQIGIEKRAQCKYCPTTLKCNSRANGTSSLAKHTETVCKGYPGKVDLEEWDPSIDIKIEENSTVVDWPDPIRVRSFGSNLRKNPLSRDGANPWCFGDDRFPLEVIRRFSCGGSCEDSSVVAGGGLDPTR
ncbi:hypothetical protein ACLB2K_040447 [Fragaria x ananassa]